MKLLPPALLLLLLGCSPEVPDGVLSCLQASECPAGWLCEARGGDPRLRCFAYPTPTSSIDAGPMSPDTSKIPTRTGNGQTFTPDAGGGYACGRWQLVHANDPPPATAKAYGLEYREEGPRDEYVCRFEAKLDGSSIVVQGRAVFGQSCLSTLPAGALVPERAWSAADFEVLVDSGLCARVVPYYDSTRLMPTGSDAAGKPTFSCVGVVKSPGGVPGMSRYLGRFELETKRCIFELNGNVRAAPSAVDPDESVEVLAVP